MTDNSAIDAAGGVVFRRRDDGKLQFLLIHRSRYDDWSLPKGKRDGGESFEACAEREVREETGSRIKVQDPIGTISYVTPAGNHKRVRYWLMEHLDGKFKRNSEVDKIKWAGPKKARAMMSYARDRAVLDRAVQMVKRPRSGRIYLVRHGLAGYRKQWKGNDRKRPLSGRGTTQAKAIAERLTAVPVFRVLTSRYTRCRETVQPLADALGLDAERADALEEGASHREMTELVKSLRSATAVLCSHGDVIEGYITHLVSEGVRIDGPLKWRKGSIWVLETRKGEVLTARYLPPPQ